MCIDGEQGCINIGRTHTGLCKGCTIVKRYRDLSINNNCDHNSGYREILLKICTLYRGNKYEIIMETNEYNDEDLHKYKIKERSLWVEIRICKECDQVAKICDPHYCIQTE